MFHGPSFQGMRGVATLGDDGIDGTIEALATPGATLDNAGQVYGWWLMASADADFLALPQSIDRIEFFGHGPSPGDALETKVRITELTDRTIAADLELLSDGEVVTRITRWVDRRFDSDEPLWMMLRHPERHLVATPVGEDCVAVEERWGDSASRELMARRYLDAAERATYEALNPRDQRAWLLGRIAAKDAVRRRLWSSGQGPTFPIEVPLADDGERAVRVLEGPAAGTVVAVAVCPWAAVAGIGLASIDIASGDGGADGAGDAQEARQRLEKELAARTPPTSTVHSEVLRSPFHGDERPTSAGAADAEPEQTQRKEYAVAWSRIAE